MDLQSLVSFALMTMFFAFLPGPGVLATTARSVSMGFKEGAILATGLIMGDLLYLLFALFGLQAIAKPMGEFFVIIPYLSAVYLIYLAYKLWRENHFESESQALRKSYSSSLFTGVLISLGNPKVMVFYLGFLPVFWDLSTMTFIKGSIIVSTVLCVLFFVMFSYAYFAAKGAGVLASKHLKLMNRTAGILMILAAIKVVQNGCSF